MCVDQLRYSCNLSPRKDIRNTKFAGFKTGLLKPCNGKAAFCIEIALLLSKRFVKNLIDER